MPGGIDTHCHLSMPFMGTVTVDNYESGSKAAVLGGTTSYIDFIIPSVGGSFVDAYKEWRGRADPESVCDFGFHSAVSWYGPNTEHEMEELVKEGVTSFKHFLAYKGALMLEDEKLVKSFRKCKELGALASVHAENGEIVAALQASYMAKGLTGPQSHPLSRPAFVEAEAAERACAIAETIGVPLMIVHNTNKMSMDAIERSRKRGNRVFAEVCGIHLALDESRYFDPEQTWEAAAHHILSPPLRSKEHVDALWGHVVNNNVDAIGSDHAAFLTEQHTRLGREAFTKIPNGCPGLQERALIMWELGVMQGRITRSKFVDLISANPCRIYGLYGKKGVIKEGADGDVAVWDPARDYTCSAKTHGSKIDFSVFEGFTTHGCPETVMVRGTVVVDDCQLTDKAAPGFGKYMKRGTHADIVFGGNDLKDAAQLRKDTAVVRN